MKKTVLICMLSVVMLIRSTLFAVSGESNPLLIKENELFSQAAVLMDASTGRVLYGKNAEYILPMASTTKIMTCIVALEESELDEIVTTSSYATTQPKVKLYAGKGESFCLKDLLYSLMLESHNDTAVMIAEHIGAKRLGLPNSREDVVSRSTAQSKEAVETFIDLMNQKARSLQCFQTYFVTPNGLDGTVSCVDETGERIERIHSTTATDLAKMMSYCILFSPMKDAFLDITGTYQYSFQNIDKTKTYSCQNHNAFLNMMDGAMSGKTGYTGNAGYCYVGALVRDDRYYVVSLLNSGAYGNKTRKWSDTKKLMQYGITHFHNKTIYEGKTKTNAVEVHNAKPNVNDYYGRVMVDTIVPDDKELKMLIADWEHVEVNIMQEKSLNAPVRENQIVGGVEVTLNGAVLAHFPIVIEDEKDEKRFIDTLKYIVYLYII